MKILKGKLEFFVLSFLFVTGTFAQNAVNEATFSYNISIESVNNKPELSKSMEGATVTVYVKGNQSRTDMVSSMGTESNAYDAKSGNGFILKEYSGQKLMITLTKENWKQKNLYFQNMKFNLENTEQEIAGFKCKRATAQLQDGKTFIVYYTPGVIITNKTYNNAFAQLPGTPVQYELESGKLKFKYTLQRISYEPVPSAKFEIPKTGYRVMTYEENQQLKKSN